MPVLTTPSHQLGHETRSPPAQPHHCRCSNLRTALLQRVHGEALEQRSGEPSDANQGPVHAAAEVARRCRAAAARHLPATTWNPALYHAGEPAQPSGNAELGHVFGTATRNKATPGQIQPQTPPGTSLPGPHMSSSETSFEGKSGG
jgi:hypothetical protein